MGAAMFTALRIIAVVLVLNISTGCSEHEKRLYQETRVSECRVLKDDGYEAVVSSANGNLLKCVDKELEARNYEKVSACADAGGIITGDPSNELLVCQYPKTE
jgi:hypothetical protein